MNKKKIIGICGYSGSGKTTLLKQVIPLLIKQGVNVGSLKHAHHDIELDIPGKDSYELRKAGSVQTAIVCDNRYAIIHETPNKPADLTTLINQFTDVDIILIEGFKHEKIPKIICHRQTISHPVFIDDLTLAVASDNQLDISIPLLDINQPQQVVKFILDYLLN